MRKAEIILLAALATPLYGGINAWTSHGPGGGPVNAVAIDPNNSGTVYVSASAAGIFKSTDGGESWNPASSGLTGGGFNLAIEPQHSSTLYAWNGRAYKSTDGAQTWNLLGLPTGYSWLAIDPQNHTVYAAAGGNGVLKSTDGGATWSAIGSGLQGLGVGMLVVDPQNPATLYAWVYSLPRPGMSVPSGPSLSAVFRSTDGGDTWSMPLEQKLIEGGGPDTHTCDEWSWYFARVMGRDAPSPEDLACYPDGDRKAQITADQYIVYLEAFAARQPQAIDFGLIAGGSRALLADPQNPGTLYTLTYRGIFKSTDGALSWSAASSGMDPRHVAGVNTIAIDPGHPGTLYAGINFGGLVYKSVDNAGSWIQVASGLSSPVNALAIDPRNSGTVYAGTGAGLFKSSDAAASWSPERPGLADSYVSYLLADPHNRGTIYAGAPGILSYKSTDGGTSWTTISLPVTTIGAPAILAIDPQTPGVLYASGNCCTPPHPALFRTVDAGLTWQVTGTAVFGGLLVIDPQNPSILYARNGLVGGGLIKSTDGGNKWTPINSGLGGTSNNVPLVYPLVIDPQTSDTLYTVRYDDGQLFRTEDGGGSWSVINTGWAPKLFHVSTLVADPQNSGTLYAGTGEFDCGYIDVCPKDYYDQVAAAGHAGLFKTTDGGQSWVRLADLPGPTGPYLAGIGTLAIDPADSHTLYASPSYTNRVFKSTDGGASWRDLSSGLTAALVTALVVDGQKPSTLYAATSGGGVFAITFE